MMMMTRRRIRWPFFFLKILF
jgi:hypothetical protein